MLCFWYTLASLSSLKRIKVNELFLGIDLGGSHISSWILDRNGRTYNPFSKIGIISAISQDGLVGHLIDLVKSGQQYAQRSNCRIVAVGLASPGPLDPNEGSIISPPNLPNIKNLEVVKILQEKTNLPIFLINDADAAVLGEYWLGSARGFNNVVMLTLGTGVGSGVVLNRRLQRGGGMASEWGHTTIWSMSNREDRKCSCGRHNCLEAFCGTEGLAQTYCNVFGVRRMDLSSEFIQEISKKMRKRADSRWDVLFEAYCHDLTEGIINIINVHQPDCVVLGGGIACDSMAKKVKTLLQETYGYKLDIMIRGVNIRVAANFQAVIIGAAKYAIDSYDIEIAKNRMEHGVYS